MPMAFFFADDVEVLRLTVRCVSMENAFWIQPYRAQLSLPQRKGVAEEYESDDDDVHSEGSFVGTHHQLSHVSESDRGVCSLCSLVDSELEMDPGTPGEESQALAADTRIAAGAFSNGSDGGDESEPPNTRGHAHARIIAEC